MSEKKFDQFGNDVTAAIEREKQVEWVTIKIPREDVDRLYYERMERYSKPFLIEQGQFMMALAHIQGAVALLEVTDKETAKKAMADAVGDLAYLEGKAAAEVRGNPKGLDVYERYQAISFENAPFIPYTEVLEDSETRYVAGATYCAWADSIRKIAEMFPDYATQDVIEVVASRCDKLDSGRVEGFDPGLKFRRVRFILDDLIGNPPSDGCFFEFIK
jgi:hypothetical protein